MRYKLIVVFVGCSLVCFAQSSLKFSYFETDETIYEPLFEQGKVDSNDILSIPRAKYKKDSVSFQSMTVNDSLFVTGFSRIHENGYCAFEAEIFSYMKVYSSFFDRYVFPANEIIKTYYPTGAVRSYTTQVWSDSSTITECSLFFDSKSAIAGENIVFGKDTLKGTFLTNIINNDTLFKYVKYESGKAQYSFYAEPAYQINPNKWKVYKIVNEQTKEVYQTKEEIDSIAKNFTFIKYFRYLIISDKKDLCFDKPIVYEYIKYFLANE